MRGRFLGANSLTLTQPPSLLSMEVFREKHIQDELGRMTLAVGSVCLGSVCLVSDVMLGGECVTAVR